MYLAGLKNHFDEIIVFRAIYVFLYQSGGQIMAFFDNEEVIKQVSLDISNLIMDSDYRRKYLKLLTERDNTLNADKFDKQVILLLIYTVNFASKVLGENSHQRSYFLKTFYNIFKEKYQDIWQIYQKSFEEHTSRLNKENVNQDIGKVFAEICHKENNIVFEEVGRTIFNDFLQNIKEDIKSVGKISEKITLATLYKNPSDIKKSKEINHNSFSLAGFVLGLVSIFLAQEIRILPFFAVFFSFIGLSKFHKLNKARQWQALLGFVLGIVFIIYNIKQLYFS
ncbi:MAG: hypothetical protein PWP31_1649 [Clostridia bacterium]|nr:hypothetical protein [Clostridia bacterium]